MDNAPDSSADSSTPDGFADVTAEPFLGDDYGEPVDLGEPEVVTNDHGATARTARRLLDKACGGFGMPLSGDEVEDFERDLSAVLAKYEVSNFRYEPEANLAMTTVEIIGRRVMAATTEAESDDSPSDREEARGEGHGGTAPARTGFVPQGTAGAIPDSVLP